MPSLRLPLSVLAISVAFAAASVAPAAAAADDPASGQRATSGQIATMLDKINAARAQHGAAPVQLSGSVTNGCRSYARRILRTNRFRHAANLRTAEILALTRGTTGTDWVVNSWLKSSTHRKVLLGGSYRSVGIAAHKGRMGGRKTTVWVVRFAR